MADIRLATRGSALARWQTEHVRQALHVVWPHLDIQTQIIATSGEQMLDKPLSLIGGKGVFTAELETALRERAVDIAVHSLKDLPTEETPGLVIGAILPRGNPQDVLISREGYTLATMPQGATVGTSSRRRAAQLLRHRPDLRMADIRGNVDTRIRKALDPEGIYDAIALAAAGLERLEQTHVISEYLYLDVMLPAPGQAALAAQCRDEAESLALLVPIRHVETEIAVTAERAFLAGLGSGCALPVAAYAVIENQTLRLRGRVTAPDGSKQVDVESSGAAEISVARAQGAALAQAALGQGVKRLLEV